MKKNLTQILYKKLQSVCVFIKKMCFRQNNILRKGGQTHTGWTHIEGAGLWTNVWTFTGGGDRHTGGTDTHIAELAGGEFTDMEM